MCICAGADPKKQFKHPFTACEVFCCEVEAIFSALLESEALLDRLFAFLDAEGELDCVLAGEYHSLLSLL